MDFPKKLFFFFILVIFVLRCGTISAQEANISHKANGGLIAESFSDQVLPDPYKEYLKNLPLVHKIWNAFGASTPVYFFRYFRRNDLKGEPNQSRLHGPVSREIHELAEEAQAAVGIFKERRLFGGLLSNYRPGASAKEDSHTVAAAMEDVIVFNEESFSQRSYGYKMVAACHEATHVKYYHYSDRLIAFLAGTASAIALDQVSNVLSSVHEYGHFAATVGRVAGVMAKGVVPSIVTSQLNILDETRADTEGAFATRCGDCVSEAAKETGYLTSSDEFYRDRGYLTGSELDAIAYKLRFHSCKYHIKQKNAEKTDSN